MADLDQYMQKLSLEMGFDKPWEIESSGSYMLPLEEDLKIKLTKTDRGISLTADLGDCPHYKRESFLSELMHANLFGQGTGNAVLGLNKNGSKVTLSHHIEQRISYDDFSAIVENFINISDFWRDEMKTYK